MKLIFLQKLGKKHSLFALIAILGIIMSSGINMTPAFSSTGQFYQGAGYQAGAYDLNASQPTAFNWTRQSRFNGPQNPGLKWSFQSGGVITSSPAITSGGTVYVGSRDYKLYSLNPDGTQKWAFQTAGPVNSSPAIGADGTVYVGSTDGKLYAINPNGSQKWAFQTGGIDNSSPAIGSDGTIYVGSTDGYVYAVNSNGTKKWSFKTNNTIESSPVIGSDGTIYINSRDGNLYAIKPKGRKKWSITTGGSDSSPAIGSDGTIYFGTFGYLCALNPTDGSTKWQHWISNYSIDNTPAIGSDGTVYIGCMDGKLYAVNSNGTQKWAIQTGYSVESSPLIGADGTVYVSSADHKLYALNPNGTQKWAFQTGGVIYSSPAIGSDGTVYIGSFDNKLYAINTVLDTSPPSTSIILNGTTGNNGWYTSKISVSLSSTDNVGGSGVAKTEYSLDGMIWNSYTPFTIDAEGTSTVYCRSTDNAGNVEQTKQQRISVDKTLPIVSGAATTSPNTLGWYNTDVTVHFTAADAVSGVYSVTTDTTITTEGSNQSVSGTATDNAGNSASFVVGGINIDKTKPTAIISSPATNLSVNGTVNIIGTAADANLYSGTVEFGSGTVPTSWTQLASLTGSVNNDLLATWDTTGIMDGTFTLRLTVNDEAGNVNSSLVNVRVLKVYPGTASYKYDGLNRLIKVTYTSGDTVDYNYDAAGNLLSVTKTSP